MENEMKIVCITDTKFGIVREYEPITEQVVDDMYQFTAYATGTPLDIIKSTSCIRFGAHETSGIIGTLVLWSQDAPEPGIMKLASGATVESYEDAEFSNQLILRWHPQRHREVTSGDSLVSDDYLDDHERLAKEDNDYYWAAGGQDAYITGELEPEDVQYWEPVTHK